MPTASAIAARSFGDRPSRWEVKPIRWICAGHSRRRVCEAIALAAGIEALVGEARPHPSQLAPATTPWLRAALHLRAHPDLVATHFHPPGRTRTPDAAATDTRAFDAGLVDLGHLAAIILSAEEPLALRAL